MKYFFRCIGMGAMMTLAFLFSHCKTAQEPEPPTAPADFIAGDSNLTDILTWKRFGTLVGKLSEHESSLLATTHRSNDTSLVRIIFAKNSFVPMMKGADGRYPVGTMVMKLYRRRTSDSTFLGGTMMVKRGGEFARINPTGWEWMTISTTGTISSRARSDSTARTACINCHQNKATSNDYLFSTPR